MSPAFLTCIPFVLQREGGFQCDPQDPGNWTGGEVGAGVLVGTNGGISAPMLAEWRGFPITQDDMRALSKEERLAIFESRFWAPMQGDAQPLPLAFVTLDAAVMSGRGGYDSHHVNHERAVGWLQEAIGVTPDGQVGPATLAAAQACSDLAAAVKRACLLRLNFLTSLPTWSHFGDGWQKRVDLVQSGALALIAPAPPAGAAA